MIPTAATSPKYFPNRIQRGDVRSWCVNSCHRTGLSVRVNRISDRSLFASTAISRYLIHRFPAFMLRIIGEIFAVSLYSHFILTFAPTTQKRVRAMEILESQLNVNDA